MEIVPDQGFGGDVFVAVADADGEGEGPLEIHGYRSTFTSTDWIASRTSYYASGDAQLLSVPKMVFYFASDGHNHWQIKDFDSY